MARIMIVDDHALVRDGLTTLLTGAGMEVVAAVADGPTAIERAPSLKPDLILMDINMPGMSGIEAARTIKGITPQSKIVMLSAIDDDQSLFDAMELGADGYILKDTSSTQLVEMLEGALKGEPPLSPQLAARMMREFREPEPEPEDPRPEDLLTRRELEVLAEVVAGRSNVQISRLLRIAEGTVKRHVSNLLAKLNVSNRAEAAVYAVRHGLLDD